MTFLPENSSTEIARLKIASWDHATFHSQVWNRRQFVPRASFKTKTTTKALIGLHNPYFWIWRPFLQPISIGPGIQSEEKKAQRRSFKLPQCDLPGVPNTTPKPYTWSCCKFLTNIFPFLSLSLRMNLLWKEIWWKERYGLAYLSQLPCNYIMS